MKEISVDKKDECGWKRLKEREWNKWEKNANEGVDEKDKYI